MTSDAVYVSLLLLELDFRKRQRETKLVTVYVQNWIRVEITTYRYYSVSKNIHHFFERHVRRIIRTDYIHATNFFILDTSADACKFKIHLILTEDRLRVPGAINYLGSTSFYCKG